MTRLTADLFPRRGRHPNRKTSEYSALCTKCLVVALAGCSLSVTANVRTKGRRPLVLACDIVTKLSASHRGVRTSEGVDLWPLRAMSLAVEASAADVPDNRPLSGGPVGRQGHRGGCGSVGHSWQNDTRVLTGSCHYWWYRCADGRARFLAAWADRRFNG